MGALTALDTGVFVHFQMIDADFVEQPIDGAQRAERLTEKAEDKNARGDGHKQDAHF